ncbi:hypothetical protein [Pseudomonas amygdali]|uniref:hypothetical protein n=1 Tax=Pseudomonas amygdali TaxID=47877 RepID=UPI0015E427B6|nr:hypothetical protein [Pseudomonas amygdali]
MITSKQIKRRASRLDKRGMSHAGLTFYVRQRVERAAGGFRVACLHQRKVPYLCANVGKWSETEQKTL